MSEVKIYQMMDSVRGPCQQRTWYGAVHSSWSRSWLSWLDRWAASWMQK